MMTKSMWVALWTYTLMTLLVPLSVKITQLGGQIDRCYSHLGRNLTAPERYDYAMWLSALLAERYDLTRED